MSQSYSLQKLVIAGVAGAISAISFQGSAEASLIDDQIFGCVSLSNICPSDTDNLFINSSAIVGTEIEFFGTIVPSTPETGNLLSVEADFSESMLTITAIANTAIANNVDFDFVPDLFWEFENLDWTDSPGKIVDVIPLLRPSVVDITFGDDFVNIATENFIIIGENGIISKNYKFQIVTEHQLVPEPSFALSLLTLGTISAGSALKRKLKPSKSTEKELEKAG